MNTSTKQTENLAECGNKSKPLLADVLNTLEYAYSFWNDPDFVPAENDWIKRKIKKLQEKCENENFTFETKRENRVYRETFWKLSDEGKVLYASHTGFGYFNITMFSDENLTLKNICQRMVL
jgi:Txe/YoeB family toxin of Txe-Axe toxin-antitoxin module